MTGTDASCAGRSDHEDSLAASAAAKWLPLAAAPAFLIMAMLTVVLDRGMPKALCSAAGDLSLGGMPPMYLLMAAFHSAPWLKLISRRGYFSSDSFVRSRSFWPSPNNGAKR
jgi:hypothetical protein